MNLIEEEDKMRSAIIDSEDNAIQIINGSATIVGGNFLTKKFQPMPLLDSGLFYGRAPKLPQHFQTL